MSNTIEIRADMLKSASLCVDANDTRLYLRGIYIDPEGWMVSTNGHILFAARLDGQIEPGCFIPFSIVKQILGSFTSRELKTCFIFLQKENDQWSLTTGELKLSFPGSPADWYPEWRKVLPRNTECFDTRPCQFNPNYISIFGRIAKILGGKETAMRIIHNHNSACPVLFCNWDNFRDDVFGLIMPVREPNYDEKQCLPTWKTICGIHENE